MHVFQRALENSIYWIKLLDSEKYVSNLRILLISNFKNQSGDKADIIMNTDASYHRSHTMFFLLSQNNFSHMILPARSPDSNVIEHIWCMCQSVITEESDKAPVPKILRQKS